MHTVYNALTVLLKVPLDGGGEDAAREERLEVVKRACLRIATSCSNTLQVTCKAN